jgi:hypothetical protein
LAPAQLSRILKYCFGNGAGCVDQCACGAGGGGGRVRAGVEGSVGEAAVKDQREAVGEGVRVLGAGFERQLSDPVVTVQQSQWSLSRVTSLVSQHRCGSVPIELSRWGLKIGDDAKIFAFVTTFEDMKQVAHLAGRRSG